MKNIALSLVAMATLGAGLTSCNGVGGSAKVSSDVDSLSMALGVIVGNNFKEYIDQLPGGPGKKDSLLMGFEAGLDKEQAYVIALQNAGQVAYEIKSRTEGASANKAVLMNAFKRALEGDTTLAMNQQDAMEYYRSYQSPKQREEAKVAAQEASANKAAGEAFLAANATKEGVKSTASGLQYIVEKAGAGKTPSATDRVKVNYRGTLIDGTEFDKGEGVVFGVNQVIPGWTEALQLMTVGAKYKLFIPSNIAYGERQAGDKIKPNSALIFDVELVSIEK
ncbi:MAG: FKBP-type peptidyl-prolyl cis-trans isomerase [Bacteroidales bacterium]